MFGKISLSCGWMWLASSMGQHSWQICSLHGEMQIYAFGLNKSYISYSWTCLLKSRILANSICISSFIWLRIYKIVFIFPAMNDHLAWETIKFSCRIYICICFTVSLGWEWMGVATLLKFHKLAFWSSVALLQTNRRQFGSVLFEINCLAANLFSLRDIISKFTNNPGVAL